MRKIIWLIPLLLLTLTQFNNCSPYAQSDTSELSSLGDLVCDTDCITPEPANLSITPNLYDGTIFKVHGGLGDFDIAGDCNEGGYAQNAVIWELYDAGLNKVRDSSQAGAVSSCVNGRFKIYVKLTAIQNDPVNRTGLYVNGQARQQYTLQLRIYGILPNGMIQAGNSPTAPVTLVGI